VSEDPLEAVDDPLGELPDSGAEEGEEGGSAGP